MDKAFEALEAALGSGQVREAQASDEIDGVRPQWVATVDGTGQTVEAMRVAARHGLRVVPRGSGSKLDWGAAPQAVDLVLDLSPANEIVEHAAGDLVLQAKAGTPLREVRARVAEAGQQLAIDHPLPSATVGGVIATALSGPGRHHFGSVRDLLIGVTVVLADGTLAISGGKVVKNVAGYDLGKLYTGSFGTLGVITEAVFRLHPLAVEQRWMSVTTGAVAEALAALRKAQAMPTAVEVNRAEPGDEPTICAQIEGRPDVTHARTRELADAVTAATGSQAEVLDSAPRWWGTLPFGPDDSGLRLGTLPARVPELLAKLTRSDLAPVVRGAAGLGVLHAGVPADADPAAVSEFVTSLRHDGGYAVLERAPRAVRELVDPWGPIDPGVLKLMQRTKNQFDPEHRLAPGRFVGGI